MTQLVKIIHISIHRAKLNIHTVYILIFAVYTFSLYSQMIPRPRKLILVKIHPGIASLPVSDRQSSPGPQKPSRTSSHSYRRVQLHRMCVKYKNCRFDLTELRRKKIRDIFPECISSVVKISTYTVFQYAMLSMYEPDSSTGGLGMSPQVVWV